MSSLLLAWIIKRPITWAAMLFVALSVLVNIVVYSVSDGMITGFIDKAINGSPHFELHRVSPDGLRLASRYEERAFDEALAKLDYRGLAMSILQTEGLAALPESENRTGVLILGVDPAHFDDMYARTTSEQEVASQHDYGQLLLQPHDRLVPVVMGRHIARDLGVSYGQEIELYGLVPARVSELSNKPKVKKINVQVVAVRQFADWSKMNSSIYMSLDNMQKFMNRHGEVSEISSVYLKGGLQGETVDFQSFPAKTKELRLKLYNDVNSAQAAYHIRSTLEQKTWLFQNIKDISVVKVIVYLVIVLAAFATYLLIHMMMKEKTKTLGLVMALGMSTSRIFVLVLCYGLFLSVLGATLGWYGGLVFMDNINTLQEKIIGGYLFSGYNFTDIPNGYTHRLGLMLSLSTVGLCTLSAFIPAIIASRTQPAIVLKTE